MDAVSAGVLGIDSMGLFHLERLSQLDRWTVSVACDADPQRLRLAEHLASRWESDWRTAIAASDVDGWFLASNLPNAESIAAELLSARKHVAAGALSMFDSSHLGALARRANEAGVSLTIGGSRRFTPDFASLHDELKRGRVGRIRSLRYVSATPGVLGEATTPAERFLRLRDDVEAAIDQLLSLVDAEIHDVAVRSTTHGAIACVRFVDGADALLEWRRGTRAPASEGWWVIGEAGEIYRGRLYTSADDGEIIDEPVPVRSCGIDDWYSHIADRWTGATPLANDVDQWRRWAQLLNDVCRTLSVVVRPS